MATALALLDLPPSSEHPLPPLECLFTVDEETGLTGAFDLDPTLLSGMPLVSNTHNCSKDEQRDASSSTLCKLLLRQRFLRGCSASSGQAVVCRVSCCVLGELLHVGQAVVCRASCGM